MNRALGWGVMVAALAMGCDDGGGGDSADAEVVADAAPPPECTAGEEEECTCPDPDSIDMVADGLRVCSNAGQWGECVCEEEGPAECDPGSRQLCACRDAEGNLPRFDTPGFRTCLVGNTYTSCECLSRVSESEFRQFYPIDVTAQNGVYPFPCAVETDGFRPQRTLYSFDEEGRLQQRTQSYWTGDRDGELIADSAFQYNDFGNITRIDLNRLDIGEYTESVYLARYTEENRRLRVEGLQVDGATFETFTYELDPGGQHLTVSGTAFNKAESREYEFDSAGRMTRRQVTRGEDQWTTSFVYDANSRLTEMTVDAIDPLDADEIWRFSFDGKGRRNRTDRVLRRRLTGESEQMDLLDAYWVFSYLGDDTSAISSMERYSIVYGGGEPEEYLDFTLTYEYDEAGNVSKQVRTPREGAGEVLTTTYDYSCFE